MIIVVCTDDRHLVNVAERSRASSPDIFGKVYQVFHDTVPQLGDDEPLFIIAHGAMEGDDGNPVIGDRAHAFYVNAVELHLNIANAFPARYRGGIYIDACESADHTEETFSFAEAFKTQVQRRHGGVRVFGRNGTAGGLIPRPGNGWTEA